MSGRRSRQPRGFVLLMSMLILAAVIAIAAGLAKVVFSGVYTARGLNSAIIAYFASESGVERSLFRANQTRLFNGQLSTALGIVNAYQNLPLSDVAAAYTVTGARSEKALLGLATEKVQFGLERDQNYTLDLFDPDNLTAAAGSPGFGALSLTFADGDPSNAVSPWLEVTLIELTPGITFDPNTAAQTFVEENPGGAGRAFAACPDITPCYINALRSDRAYRARIKALYDAAANVKVIPCANDNCAAGATGDIQSQFVIKSVGRYPLTGTASAQQAIQVSQSWLVPSSPLFDYTLFSEQPLEKR